MSYFESTFIAALMESLGQKTRPDLARVFLSWSGNVSLQIAGKLQPWLESVHHGIDVFYSPESIGKGTPWFGAVSDALAKSEFGLIILTPENLNSSWLLFESGALSKQVDRTRLHPVLFRVQHGELPSPLAQFQATLFTKDEVWRLLSSINGEMGQRAIELDRLRRTYDQLWPKLFKSISQVLESLPTTEPTDVLRDLGLTFEVASSILHEVHRRIEGKFHPDVVLTMSGPGSFSACFCMSLDSRNIPVLMAVTFPLGDAISQAHESFRNVAEEAHWVQVVTSKWDVYLPDVLWKYAPGTKVLVFDDRVVTGETQQRVKSLLEAAGLDVRCAAMLTTQHAADHYLDFYGRVADHDYYLPWGSKRGRT